MKKTAKKLLSTLLALIMLLSLSAPAFAAGSSIDNATSISFDRTYSGSTSGSYEDQFFKFIVSSSGILSVEYKANNISFTYIYIYDENGQTVWSAYKGDNSQTNATSFYEKVGLNSGKYYFAISGSTAGKYNFSLSFKNANESFKETLNSNNDTMEKANTVSFNKNYKGLFGPSDKTDYYRFTINGNSQITFSYNGDNILYTSFKIFDSTGETVWSKLNVMNNSTTQKTNLETSINLSTGTYYLFINANFANKDSIWGTYNFSLTTNGSTVTPTPTPDPEPDVDTDVDTTPSTDFDIGAFFSSIWSFFVMVFNWIVGLFS